MGARRTSLFLIVVFMHLQYAISKPFLEPIICDFFCTDNDNTTTTISSNQQDIFDMLCEDCTPRRRTTTTQAPVNLMIPPMNGMNLTMVNQGGNWMFNMIPWGNGAQNSNGNVIPNANALPNGNAILNGMPIVMPTGRSTNSS